MKYKLLLLTLLLTTTGVLLINCTNNETSLDAADTAKEDSLKQSIERGEYLATRVAICIDCHSERDYKYFSGPVKEGTEGMGGEVFDNNNVGLPGVIYARNITSDSVTGIGSWTDEEIFTAITRGISRNGDTLFPLMPYHSYNKLARQDVMDIIAYIRTLKPIEHTVPQRQLMVPLHMVYPPGINTSLDSNQRPSMDNKLEYGRYLVNTAACFDCHTQLVQGKPGTPFAGGFTFNMPGFTVVSANITPDDETGIGKWTEEMFLQKFTQYRDKQAYLYDPGKQNTIMPWSYYANLDDYDLKAIYAYLRTLPPVKNAVVKHPGVSPAP